MTFLLAWLALDAVSLAIFAVFAWLAPEFPEYECQG